MVEKQTQPAQNVAAIGVKVRLEPDGSLEAKVVGTMVSHVKAGDNSLSCVSVSAPASLDDTEAKALAELLAKIAEKHKTSITALAFDERSIARREARRRGELAPSK